MADVPGGPVTYTVVLPDGYRPGRRYPVLVALPPGLQTRAQVDATLDRVWRADPARRRWVIVSPEAPAGTLFLDGGERVLVPFLAVVERRYPPRGGRVALAGVSNGGISAFALALAAPRRVGALLAAPGYPPAGADLTRLRGIRITMFVGESDSGFRPPMEATFFALRRHRIPVALGFSPGDGHVVTAIPAADWYAALTPR